jgi:hypothetical protein
MVEGKQGEDQMKHARIVFVFLAASFLATSQGYCQQPVHLSGADRGAVPSSLFNLNILGISDRTGWPSMPFASWRSFHFNWNDVEPAKDRWAFARPDHDVQEALKHHVDLLAILETIPAWAASAEEASNPAKQIAKPASLAAWADYVRTVAQRYKGQIHYYELWNEPMGVGTFLRDPSALTALNRIAYETLKSVDPTIVVLSPALSSGDPVADRPLRHVRSFGDAGIWKHSDVVAYHFYVAPVTGSTTPRIPEDMLPYINAVSAKMKQAGVQKPLWSTESGWYVLNDDQNPEAAPWYLGKGVEPDLGAAYLARTYILGWTAGLDRIYWYCWRHGYMGLTQYGGGDKAPGIAFATIQRWLVGAQLNSCDRNKDGNWLCQLKRADGSSGVISWTEASSAQLDIDPAWNAHRYSTIDGKEHDLGDQASIQISGSPIFLPSSR